MLADEKAAQNVSFTRVPMGGTRDEINERTSDERRFGRTEQLASRRIRGHYSALPVGCHNAFRQASQNGGYSRLALGELHVRSPYTIRGRPGASQEHTE